MRRRVAGKLDLRLHCLLAAEPCSLRPRWPGVPSRNLLTGRPGPTHRGRVPAVVPFTGLPGVD
jgi:hypothetical protein